ncbi:flagellar hook-length control protein FliK [Roseovarius arcticus]|uniref:flagellar hook-length control protein FliK n=1 Tax=Roseovarius arcticus TaxID=2547404 RepID=UPI0011103068|nr:flagellar hook-length control protein FliK [Roseovarius arcticus]
MLGSLTTPNSARAHPAAVAEHDKAARAPERTTAQGDAVSKALTFQSFLEEKKDGAPRKDSLAVGTPEDSAAPADSALDDDQISAAPIETDSEFIEADSELEEHEEDDTLMHLDGLGDEFSEFAQKNTSQSSWDASVADQLGGQSIDDSPQRDGPAGIEASGLTMMGRTANTLPQSKPSLQPPDIPSATQTMLAGIAAETASDLPPTSAGQGTSSVVSDGAMESHGSVETSGRSGSVIVGGSKLGEIAEPPRLVLPTSSEGVDPKQVEKLVGQPGAEVAPRSPLLLGNAATPVEEFIPRAGHSSVINGNAAQLNHAWPMKTAQATTGFKITATVEGLPSADILPGDSRSAVMDVGDDANLALEGATHRAVSEARTASLMLHHGATTTRNVAAQISEAMAKAAERSIDVILNPAELGRVRITLSYSDAGMIVNVAAERAETLEMMRRHSDILGQEFTDLGYGGTDFTFAHEDGANEDGGSQGRGEAAPDASPAPKSDTTIILRAAPADRLDIRL